MDSACTPPCGCAPEPRADTSAFARRLIPVAILMTALCAMTGNGADTDLWGHVTYGRELIRDGALPETTTWSYVTRTTPWINHENLSELALASTYDTFGILGLTLGKLLLATIIVCCLMFTARRAGAGWAATAIAVVVAADTMQFHWHFRPQAFTYTFFALEILLLDTVFRQWRGEWRGWKDSISGVPSVIPREAVARLPWLCLAPLLFIVWTNTHGGFAAGVAIYVAYLGMRAVEAWAWWGRAAWLLILRIGFLATMALLATLLTPYGGELHAWMLKAIAVPQPEIVDWRPIQLFSDPDAIGLWVMFALWFIGLTFSGRRKDVTQLIILAVTLWQALSHVRHLVFFALLCGAWLPVYLEGVLQRLTADARERINHLRTSARPQRLGTAMLLVWTGFVTALLVPRLQEITVRRDWYPVAAMQYLADHDLRGKVLVDFNWAQYAIMCFAEDQSGGPRSQVAIDGRYTTCYSRETLDVFLDFTLGDSPLHLDSRSPHSPPFDPERALQIGPPDLVLVSRERPQAMEVLERHKDEWTLLYQDGLSQLWGRRDRYDRPTQRDYVPLALRVLSDVRPEGTIPWPALPESPTNRSIELARR